VYKQSAILVLRPCQALALYWHTFTLWTGCKKLPHVEEPENVLPPVSREWN
jgi:hypothetical protein